MAKMKEANHSAAESTQIVDHANDFLAAVQAVLKKEWKRVKYGEPLYRVISLSVFVSVLFFIIIAVRQNGIFK